MEKFFILSVMFAVIFVATAVRAFFKLFTKVLVYENERALLYRDGKFVKTLEPGKYWLWSRNMLIKRMDIRAQWMHVPSQELLTADNMQVKISLVVQYRVLDVYTALELVENHYTALYTMAQLALREVIAPMKIEELMTARDEVAEALTKALAPKAAEFGVEVILVGVRDMMLPGEVKKIMSQVVKAQMESKAALEKARGETAALRSLANAARMLESTPALMQLRLMQSLGESTGNTIVFGATSNGLLLPTTPKKGSREDAPSE